MASVSTTKGCGFQVLGLRSFFLLKFAMIRFTQKPNVDANLQTTPPDWHDPIVQELHAVREKLVEKYQCNLHAYSQAARARSLALGFQFTSIKTQPKSSTVS
jgi:hypothetical protein